MSAMDCSSLAPTPPDWRNDVFVSFRGEDTRRGFASHLFHALKQADIHCYRDVERHERGQVVGPMLIKAIRESRIAIVVFSTNYADSKWCLKELVEILECNRMYKDHGHMVIPVFYDVEPSEVRRLSGKFGEGFKRSESRDKKEREAWRAALEEAGNVSSWHLDSDARDEAELIELIIDDLSNRVFYFHSPYFTNNAVGLDQNIDDLISLLNVESGDIRVIGIFGMEGIGKTSIAKAICSRLYSKFEGVSLLGDIRDANNEHNLVNLQKQLLQNILKIKHVKLSDRRNNNIGVIRTRLCQKKILLVLDKLDKKEQAYSILGEHDFLGPGSRILITTRDEQLLDDLRVDKKFMVSGLNPSDSLQLFCHHAFAQGSPREGYEELSSDLIHYAGGIPLAIETFASFLSGKMRDEWHQILEQLVKNPCLDSLGVYLRSVSPLYPFKSVGPYGGSGNTYFLYDDKTHTTVRKIKVVVYEVVRSIITEYDHDGSLVRSNVQGKPYDSASVHEFALDYPNEFLISVSGCIAESYGFRVIRSIKFLSNKRMYGPFGEDTGTPFTFPAVDNGRIVGFFGKCDTSICSVGAYFGPIPHPYPLVSGGSIYSEGETWDDKTHMDIRQIDVVSSSVIESVSVLYDNYGHPLGPFTHGRADRGEEHTVILDYPYEYLTSISGYTCEVSGKVRVRSLTFQSNKRMYGPFGPEIGMHFQGQWNGGKVMGFYGTVEGSHLESIRAHIKPVSHIHPSKDAGPFGGERGRYWDDERRHNLRRIVITWERVINSIKCVYEVDGVTAEGVRHGGSGGSDESTIDLDYPNEYIGMMSGYYGEVDGFTVIISLMLQSNVRTYGPFGGEERRPSQTYFRTPWNIGMINGFYGRSGKFLTAIGAHFSPVYHKLPLKTIGPFGDDSRVQWEDGRHTGIRQINLRSCHILDSISCVYDDDGETVEGSNHGGDGGYPHVIKLDHPHEYVRSISGYTGQFGDHMCIRSLTFGTNRRRFGPFGREDGTPFFFESNDSTKIVGFFGSSSIYLHSIGVHVESLSGESQSDLFLPHFSRY